jgi:sugar (glycoside-pentoside-hexuronide) transporter
MKKTQILGYGIGSFGKDFTNIVISSYLLVFYTNVLGIAPATAGIIMMVSKIWDAINDPMMGVIADKTNTRWGKFRPYILFVPIPLAVFSVLTFLNVDFSYIGKVVWAAVTYNMTSMLFTMYDVPMLGMVPTLTEKPNERSSLVASGRFFTTVAIMAGVTLAFPLIEKFGGGSETENLSKGYPLFLALMGGVSCISAWIAFANTKEVVRNVQSSPSIKDLLKTLVGNKPLIVLQLANLFFSMGMMTGTSIGVFYILYFIEKPELIASYMFVLTAAFSISTFMVSPILKKISKEIFIIGAVVIVCICNVFLFVFGKTNIPLLYILSAISSGASFAPAIVLTIMVTDVADNTEYKEGYRADGVLFSINSFAIKVATAVNSGLIGIMLSLCGYDALNHVQSAATQTGINAIRYIYQAIALVICVIILKKYPLNEGRMKTVREALKIKREGADNHD